MPCPSQTVLDRIFPPERTDAFFEALFGGAEEGAYNIRLECRSVKDNEAELALVLYRRPGQCLKCNLTYGLPQVFQRHPIINMTETAQQIAAALGWKGPINWSLGKTVEISDDQHEIPLTLQKS